MIYPSVTSSETEDLFPNNHLSRFFKVLLLTCERGIGSSYDIEDSNRTYSSPPLSSLTLLDYPNVFI